MSIHTRRQLLTAAGISAHLWRDSVEVIWLVAICRCAGKHSPGDSGKQDPVRAQALQRQLKDRVSVLEIHLHRQDLEQEKPCNHRTRRMRFAGRDLQDNCGVVVATSLIHASVKITCRHGKTTSKDPTSGLRGPLPTARYEFSLRRIPGAHRQ